MAALTGPHSVQARDSDAAIATILDKGLGGAGDAYMGCAAGVFRSGKPAVIRNYGLADVDSGRRISAATPFNLGSDSKQFTAFAIARLAADGRLSLTDDVHKYLPELPDYGRRVEIRDLLFHTSGIVDYYDLWDLVGVPAHMDPASGLAALKRVRHLNLDPGRGYIYSNSNYQLLALIIERVAGKPFRDYMAQAVFRPFGMKDTSVVTSPAELPADRAITYRRSDQKLSPIPMVDFMTGATGVYSTVDDLARWNAGLVRQAHAPRAAYRIFLAPGRLRSGEPILFGAGNEVRTVEGGVRVYAHGGESLGYISSLFSIPRLGFGGAVLCNTGRFQPGLVTEAVIRSRIPAYDESGRVGAPPIPDLPTFAGLYRFDDGETEDLVETAGGLALGGLPRFKLQPLGGARFRVGDLPVYLEFSRDSSGAPRAVRSLFGVGPVAGARKPHWTPDVSVLAGFAGTYDSDDLGLRLRVAPGAEGLNLEIGERRFKLLPRTEDAFLSPDGGFHVVFQRDRNGAVSGLQYTSETLRTRSAPFRKAS